MNLVPIEPTRPIMSFLYELLYLRSIKSFVSHERMPSIDEHNKFVSSMPFRYWYLIEVDGVWIGALQCTYQNEIGIDILRKRLGYGSQAIRKFIETHEPLEAIPAVRNGHWLANIAVGNEDSKQFFANLGFKPIQETWQL